MTALRQRSEITVPSAIEKPPHPPPPKGARGERSGLVAAAVCEYFSVREFRTEKPEIPQGGTVCGTWLIPKDKENY
jgi:hypothetical protein